MKKIFLFILLSFIIVSSGGTMAFAIGYIDGGVSMDSTAPLLTDTLTDINTYGYTVGNPMYFRLIPTMNDTYTIQTIGTADTYAELYDVDGSTIGSGDDEVATNFLINAELIQGQTYYLLVVNWDDISADETTLQITAVGGGGLSGAEAAPAVSSVSVPSNATYTAGQNLDFTVNFSENVTVNTGGGTPYIPVTLSIGGTVNAAYQSGSGTSALVFRYTVQSGNYDADGIAVGASITANGGTLKDAAGNNATLTLNSVGATTGVRVDAIAPKAITAFNFNGLTPNVTGTVNEGAKTIALTVPYGTDVTELVPTIIHTGASISPNTGVSQNFTSPVTYTVTAADSSSQAYTVTVSVAQNTAKAITAFSFNGLTPNVTGTVNEGAKIIALTVPYGTDVTTLVPTITHTGASVSPNTGVTQDFTSPVTYTVTAADSSTQQYTVTVSVAQNTAKAITAFNFNGLTPNVTGTVNEGAKNIALTVPYGTDVTTLVPTITHTGASVSPNTGVQQDFTSPVIYTVTAADSSTQQYTVMVSVVANPAKAITAFNFNGLTPNVTGTVNEGAKTIALTVPYGTDVTTLVPTITHTGASISPSTGVPQNFTSPVTYTVTAADSSSQAYTVTVSIVANPAKAITAFNFNGLTPNVTGTVNEGAKTIALTVPYGTDVTTLVPTITHTGASVSPNTGVQQDFTSPVIYTVTAADSSTQQYTVMVSVVANPAKAITAFNFNGLTPNVTGTVNEGAKTIALTVPYGTDVTELVPTIIHTGASVSPNTGVAQDFTTPVTYTVTAADSSTQEYTVTVTVTANTAKTITAFNFNGLTPNVTGTVNEGAKAIALTVPYGTDVTELVPTITHTGASISPNTGVAQDFTNPVTYTVTAADSSTQQYTVTVSVVANPAKAITAFNFNGLTPNVTGTVNEGAKTIALTVPYGTDVTTLVPYITHTGASISPNTGVAQDFTSPVTYTVTAADSSTQQYTVTVTVAVSSNSNLSALSLNSATLSPAFSSGTTSYTASVGNADSSITVSPTVANENATVKVNGVTVSSGSASGYISLSVGNNTITVVVTAQDGTTTSTYTIIVTRAASSGGSSSTSKAQLSQNTVVVVNGKVQNAGIETQTTEAGKTIITIAVNNNVIESKIDEAVKSNSVGDNNLIQIPIADTKSDISKVELPGDIVKKLEEKAFDVSVKRDNVEYVIPAEEFTISKVAENLGVLEKDLEDIKIEIQVIKLDETLVAKYIEVAKNNGAELVFPPVSFEVTAKTVKTDGTSGRVEISKFSNYIERVMEIPRDVNPSKITTGIVINSDGTYSHVPTSVYQKDDKWYAKINSLTNSTYSVIWNTITVKSVENHWSKETVNDMASRLIVFNAKAFIPDKAITRAEFSEYIVRALGLYREGSKHENIFKDVNANGDRTLAILIANEYGIVTGYQDGTFRPDALITREEAMTMYQRAMSVTKLVGTDPNRYQSYTDYNQVSSWAATYVKEVLSANVFSGNTATTISPKSNLTYAEAAQAIKNLLVESKLINK